MRPPCVKPGVAINSCAKRLHTEKVLGHIDLAADWAGWRLRGRWLISPDGDRITPERLRGLLFVESSHQRRHKAGVNSGQQGVIVALRRREPGEPTAGGQ